GDNFALGGELDDLRGDRAAGAETKAGVGARTVGGKDAALGIDRHRAGPGDERPLYPPLAVGPDLDDRVALLLREQQPAVVGGGHAVDDHRPRPERLPLCIAGNDARDRGDVDGPLRSWLTLRSGGRGGGQG